MTDFDLIVIGGGGAGLAAAASAAERGCTVLVAEAEAQIGGSTSWSDGVFNAAGTSIQRALGYEDSPDRYFDYYMTLNAWRLPPGVVRAFCDNAVPTLEWLLSLDVEIPARLVHKIDGIVYPSSARQPGLYAAGAEWPPRGHIPVGGGAAWTDTLYQYCGSLDVEFALNTRVQKLLVEDGAVVGVEVDGHPVRSRAVAVTCGGFAHDMALMRRFFPTAFAGFAEDHQFDTISAPGSRGDAIRLGEQAGALIEGANCGLMGTMAYFPRTPVNGFPGYQPNSLIYVNRAGRRFADETAPYAVMPGIIQAQGNVVWGIFDEASRLRADPMGSGYAQGWDPAFVEKAVESGDIKRGGSIRELAEATGLGAEPLEAAVRHYNEDLATGEDRHFQRPLSGLHPIATPPFYAFEYRPTNIFLTGAGPRINADGQVLNERMEPIAGLFAAGESGAGVLGERYVGGGNSVANALTMGRTAGISIAAQLGRTTPRGILRAAAR